jgi:hypothetical protein
MKLSAIAHAVIVAAMMATLGCGRSDREAAIDTIQAVGGTLSYDEQGRVVSVNLSDTQATDEELAAISALPYVHTINCTNAHRIAGNSLYLLGNLKNLETLYLVRTDLEDSGLAGVQNLMSLKTLSLDGTGITDAGMPALANLNNLQTLVLGDTAITDSGLVPLRNLRKLSTLILRDTKTTGAGIQELHRMLPEVRIVD